MSVDAELLARRLPVWKALSELFLDTELDQSSYRYIASQIKASGFTTLEVEDMLWQEVFPALADNLRIVAGEWAGFSDDWLQERILNVINGTEKGPGFWGLTTVKQTRRIVSESWDEVRRCLSGGTPLSDG